MEMSGGYNRVSAIVDLDAIRQNVVEIKRNISENTKLMMIIKADAYGHGCIAIARMLEAQDGICGYDELVDAYGVAIIEEGIELREAGVRKRILILGYTAPELYNEVVRYDISQTIFQYESACLLSETAQKQNKTVGIHIKIDTGMGRIGYIPNDESIEEIIRISKLPGIRVEGVFSHLSKADETDKGYSHQQFKCFLDFCEKLEQKGLVIPLKHISNSAAIIDMPEMNLDLVRPGIINYGMYPSDMVNKKRIMLKPALEWKTHVSYVKKAAKGSLISYGGDFCAKEETVIATIPVGYADGYPRQLSSKGRVIIRGQYADIVGRICMDQFMVDVTHIDGVMQGDVVTLVGCDGEACIPIEEPAALSGSFNYEFACTIGNRVPRLYIGG